MMDLLFIDCFVHWIFQNVSDYMLAIDMHGTNYDKWLHDTTKPFGPMMDFSHERTREVLKADAAEEINQFN